MKSESQNIEYKESWRDNMPIAYKGTYHYRSGSTKQVSLSRGDEASRKSLKNLKKPNSHCQQ